MRFDSNKQKPQLTELPEHYQEKFNSWYYGTNTEVLHYDVDTYTDCVSMCVAVNRFKLQFIRMFSIGEKTEISVDREIAISEER